MSCKQLYFRFEWLDIFVLIKHYPHNALYEKRQDNGDKDNNAFMDTTAICNKITNDDYIRTCPDESGSYDNCVTPGNEGKKGGPNRGLDCEAYESSATYGHFTKGIWDANDIQSLQVVLDFGVPAKFAVWFLRWFLDQWFGFSVCIGKKRKETVRFLTFIK